MTIRTGALVAGVVLAAALAGVATSQPPPPSPVAAAQVDLAPSRADRAALAQAQKDPMAARLRGGLGQNPAGTRFLALADASTVPVLGPADPALLATARLYTGDRHYMMTVQQGSRLIEIYGAVKAFRSPIPPDGQTAPTPGAAPPNVPTTAIRPGPRVLSARISAGAARAAARARARGLADIRAERTEYGSDVAFSRFGAAYSVSFICDGPGAAGCTESDAIAFASTLQLIGGARS